MKIKPLVSIALLSVIFITCKKDDPEPEPVPDFSFENNKTAPVEIAFTNNTINAVTFSWSFGDGGTSVEKNPKHTYAVGGKFTVRLTAVNGEGVSKSVTKELTVVNPAPVADFIFTPDNYPAPYKVTFTNKSTNAVSYEWNFGDGATSTQKDPSHIFTTGKVYTVSLKAINPDGVSNIITKTVTILNVPTKLRINRFVLTAIPPTDANGGGWDGSSGPDVYIKFTDASGTNYLTTGYYPDLLTTALPVTFETDFPLVINALDFEFQILLFDYDDFDPDDSMGGYLFKARDSMPTDGSFYPPYIEFTNPNSQIKFRLEVEWLD